MADLMNCPFCGKSEVDYQGSRQAFYCHTCGATGPDDPDANVESWNRRAQDVRGDAMEPIDYDALEQTLEHMAGGMDRQLHGDTIDALCDAATAISRLRSKLAEWEGDGIEKDAAISALRAAAGEPPKEPNPT